MIHVIVLDAPHKIRCAYCKRIFKKVPVKDTKCACGKKVRMINNMLVKTLYKRLKDNGKILVICDKEDVGL